MTQLLKNMYIQVIFADKSKLELNVKGTFTMEPRRKTITDIDGSKTVYIINNYFVT